MNRSDRAVLLLCIPAALIGAAGALSPLPSTFLALIAGAVLCLHPASPVPVFAGKLLSLGDSRQATESRTPGA